MSSIYKRQLLSYNPEINNEIWSYNIPFRIVTKMEHSGINLKINNVNKIDKLLVRLRVEMGLQLTEAEDCEQNCLRTAEQGQEKQSLWLTHGWRLGWIILWEAWSWEGPPQDGELYLRNLDQGPQERKKNPWGFQQVPRERNHFEKRQNSPKQGLTSEETCLIDWAITAIIFTWWSTIRASWTRGKTNTLQLDLVFPVGEEKYTFQPSLATLFH